MDLLEILKDLQDIFLSLYTNVVECNRMLNPLTTQISELLEKLEMFPLYYMHGAVFSILKSSTT